HVREALFSQPNILTVLDYQRPAKLSADPVTKIIAQHGADRGDRCDDRDGKVALACEEPGGKQDSLARDGDTGVLEHHSEEHDPVSPPVEQPRDCLQRVRCYEVDDHVAWLRAIS